MKITLHLKAEALGDPAWSERAATWVLVFPKGEPRPNDTRLWEITDADLQRVVSDFATRTEQLPIYYVHGEDPTKGKRAAGWIDKLEVREDGLYAHVRFTDEALTEIRAGMWGFRSPGFEAEEIDGKAHPIRLYEVSLVNEPAIGGMPAINASKENEMAETKTTTQTAAKKAAGELLDKPSLLTLVRENYGIPDVVSDKVLCDMIAEALEGAKVEDPAMPPTPEGEVIPQGAEADPVALTAARITKLINDGVEKKLAEKEREAKADKIVTAAVNRLGEDIRAHAVTLAKANPEAAEAILSAIPRKTPEGGTVFANGQYRPQSTVAVFAGRNLLDDATRRELDVAARELAGRLATERKLAPGAAYAEAVNVLTGATN